MDAACVSHITGSVPIAPSIARLGQTVAPRLLADDFIHYAGCATISLRLPPGLHVSKIADQLVFRSCRHYGHLFAELLEAAGGVFEAIPDLTHLNKIAQITVNDETTGSVAHAGAIDPRILITAWTSDSARSRRGQDHA